MPGFWRLAWMLFMQPVQLSHVLRACGIDPDASAWQLWRRREYENEATRAYLARSAAILVIITLLAGVALALALTLLGFEINSLGMALGVALGVAFGVAFGVAGVAFGVAGGVAFGVAGGVAFIASYTRIIVYPVEVAIQTGIYLFQKVTARLTLQFAPVLFHDLSYLPHPFLGRHILESAPENPGLSRRVLEACSVAPGQRRIAVQTLRRLQARELDEAGRARNFTGIGDLHGQWLPGAEGADPPLLAFRDIARYVRAAESSKQPYHRLNHLTRAAQELDSLENRLISERSEWSRLLLPVVSAWQEAVFAMRREAEAAAAGVVPNPFRGEPLEPGKGGELFRGRQEIVQTIENLLADPQQRVSIALLGPRRCGKTSLLKMLPVMLPDTLCVLFDIQDNPMDSPARFFGALAERTAEQARKEGLAIPPLAEGPPFEVGSRWVRELDESRNGRRVLLCLDEFERLEVLWPGEQRELLQLMGLIRATIQHRHNVRLLVSGVAPFDELGKLWNDHFVNVRAIKLEHLDHDTAIGLLTKPIPEFPQAAIPEMIAEEIFARTGGQPYLLQLYASCLVTRLNSKQRSESILEDIDAIEDDVLTQADYYLRHTVTDAPERVRTVLNALARGERPQIDSRAQRWLLHRCLITPGGQLAIPALGTWICEEFDLPTTLQ